MSFVVRYEYDGTVHRAFAGYGNVEDVAREWWRVAGFDGDESTTRSVRLTLRKSVGLERLPHQLRLGGGTALLVLAGRSPIHLTCGMTGYMRRNCRAPGAPSAAASGTSKPTVSALLRLGHGTKGEGRPPERPPHGRRLG